MECEIENKNDAHLYRLDVGVSRTYDELKEFDKILDVPKYMEPNPESKLKFDPKTGIKSRSNFISEEERSEISNKRILEQRRVILSRSPQILKIDENNDVQIIRSTISNTRIHMYRPYYEKKINENKYDLLSDLKLVDLSSFAFP
jgi:hypothetical protein